MENHPPTRESMLRYLLHEIGEDERERVDTALLCDEEYHAAFQELEYDLLDALDAGELTPAEAERARRALRPADRLRTQRFDADLRPGPVLVPPPGTQTTTASPKALSPRLPSWPVWMAAAALVLVTLAIGVRIVRMHPAGPPMQAQVDAPTAIPVPGPPGPEPTPPVVAPSPPGVAPSTPRAVPFAVLLLPGASRSPHTLHLPIPHDAALVRIDWPSDSSDAKGSHYQLQVLTDAGKVSCMSRGTALPGISPPVVRFLCPARDVPTGVDFMRITSLPADPEMPSLLEVTVSVERKPANAS